MVSVLSARNGLFDRGGQGVAWDMLPRLRATYVQDMLCSEINRKNHPLMAGVSARLVRGTLEMCSLATPSCVWIYLAQQNRSVQQELTVQHISWMVAWPARLTGAVN